MKFLKIVLPLGGLLASMTAVHAQGGVFITGHDPDYHAALGSNANGARNIINDSLQYVTNHHLGSVLLVTDLTSGGGATSDPRLGLTDAGVTFDVADYGSGAAGVKNLSTVNFTNYSAVVVASDFGGWLEQRELNILNARSTDILNYVNGGGGLVAFAESAGNPGLTTSGDFGFLPFVTSSTATSQVESNFTVTPFGQTLGLVDSDVNGNVSHNIFTSLGGLNVVDEDVNGNAISAAYYGKIGNSGTQPTPEPASMAVIAIGVLGLVTLIVRRRRVNA